MGLEEAPTYFAIVSSYIGESSITFIMGFPSPTQKQLIEEKIIDYQTLPIFSSISHYTTILGMIAVPLLVQLNINLKILATISCLIGGAGYLLIISANSAVHVIIGVALVGFLAGNAAIWVNNYVPEVALDNQRRIMTGGIGLFLVYFAGIWLSFRWLAVVGLLLICLFSILLQLNPLSLSSMVRSTRIR